MTRRDRWRIALSISPWRAPLSKSVVLCLSDSCKVATARRQVDQPHTYPKLLANAEDVEFEGCQRYGLARIDRCGRLRPHAFDVSIVQSKVASESFGRRRSIGRCILGLDMYGSDAYGERAAMPTQNEHFARIGG